MAEEGFSSALKKEGIKEFASSGLEWLGGIPGKAFGLFLGALEGDNQEKLDSVRKEEGCPHIEGATFLLQSNLNNAYKYINEKRKGVVWEDVNKRGWFYHSQSNYRVLHAAIILRWIGNRAQSEAPGSSLVLLRDCESCLQIHMKKRT